MFLSDLEGGQLPHQELYCGLEGEACDEIYALAPGAIFA